MLQAVLPRAVASFVDAPGRIDAPRVLVADDEEDIRALVCRAVRTAGCRVTAEPFAVVDLVTRGRELVA